MEIVRLILKNVLTALYQPFWFAFMFAAIFMFFIMYIEKHGLKTAIKAWCLEFKEKSVFRSKFLLVFYIVMILFKTLINRNMWMNPVSDVIGVWGFVNSKGELTTEVIENLVLFVPFTILLMCVFYSKATGKVQSKTIIMQSTLWTFMFSAAIEFLQLFLRLGTFQLSDLFYNTLGGFIGGLIYALYRKVKK